MVFGGDATVSGGEEYRSAWWRGAAVSGVQLCGGGPRYLATLANRRSILDAVKESSTS